ncbi:hypothetical protein [Nitrosomonas sp.]|uniref:hypothetical protein n=1 Tax=Nitrosomonas sp. TaxID=42353 RepID=UPI001D4D2714|nr:hypothetical protein [Nitrosomonas sp.]MBX3615582.1 hypothetical protein [Nitrosomonas sp.]
MKRFLLLSVLTGIYVLFISAAFANDFDINTKFASPGKICFSQTNLYAETDNYKSVMLNHYLIVRKEDHYKTGDVFVGFRLKSQPDVLWLYNGGVSWIKQEKGKVPEFFYNFAQIPLGQLQPVTPTSIFYHPINVSPYVGDGELWVGYGLRSESETAQVSFDEMLSSNRFDLIWEIGNSLLQPRNISGPPIICLTTTEMTEYFPVLETSDTKN